MEQAPTTTLVLQREEERNPGVPREEEEGLTDPSPPVGLTLQPVEGVVDLTGQPNRVGGIEIYKASNTIEEDGSFAETIEVQEGTRNKERKEENEDRKLEIYVEKKEEAPGAPETTIEEVEIRQTAPSVGRKRKLSDEKAIEAPISHTIEVHSKPGIIGQGQQLPPPPPDIGRCQIKKGRCLTHNIEAKKNTIKSKKWGKTKNGFGWIYSNKVEWLCRLRIRERTDQDISTSEKAGPDRSANLIKGNNSNITQAIGISRKVVDGGIDEGLEKVTN